MSFGISLYDHLGNAIESTENMSICVDDRLVQWGSGSYNVDPRSTFCAVVQPIGSSNNILVVASVVHSGSLHYVSYSGPSAFPPTVGYGATSRILTFI